MTLSELRLHHFNQRALNMLGWIFGGQDARVLLSERAENALTAVLESRTLLLDPARAGLFDLALGVRLLNYRAERADKYCTGDRLEEHDAELTARAVGEWAPRGRAELLRQFPAIRDLTGLYQLPAESFAGIKLATRSAGKLKPLPPLESSRGAAAPIAVGNLEFVAHPGIDIDGGDDFAWLLAGLNSGAVPLHTLPLLEDLPFARLPFRLCDAGGFAGMEWLEEQLSDPESRETIDVLMECIRQKSEVREEKLATGRRTVSGVRLDPNRLVEAVLGARGGTEPRPFRNRGSYIEPVFDPSEHLALVAIDLSDAWVNPGSLDLFLSNLLTVYQRLEVDLHVLAYAGCLVTLEDGREVFLQFSTDVKAVGEPMEEAFWGRILRLVRSPLALPGEAGYFHPLGMQDISRAFGRIAAESDHSYRSLLWSARRWMEGRFEDTEFVMRAADSVDFQMRELRRRLEGTFDALASYLPTRLRDQGRPGEYLNEIAMPRS